MSLSTLIVQREIASIREVEEALARQVLYGGDFVTNLLEVCRLDEAQLLPIVAESLGLAPAPPGELPRAEPDARRLIAAEVAEQRNIAPLTVDRYGLVIAVAEPLSAEAEQELSFALALPISQKIAPLVRIREALARDYGVPLDRRIQRLLQRMATPGPRTTSSFPQPRTADLRASVPRPPSLVPPAPRSHAPPPVRPSLPAGGGARTLVRKTEAPPARPLRRRRGAITVDGARTALEEAGERDAIFDLLFEFSRQYFDYTALFIVHGEIAEGRDAFGDGASRDKVARIGVPLDMPSILAVAREAKSTIERVPSAEGLDTVLMSDLGRSGKSVCVVMPVVVRTRVVALLLGDGGDTGIDGATLADVEGVVAQSSAAFERLIVRRKLKGTVPPGMGSLAPPVTMPAATKASEVRVADRPSVEELASPIRELMAEPVARPITAVAVAAFVAEPPAFLDGVRGKSDNPPPPANVLAVNRPSGRPIPREEPESNPSMPAVAVPGRGRARRGEAPKLEFNKAPERALPFADRARPDEAPAAPRAEPPPALASTELVDTDDSDVSLEDPDATPIAPPVDFDGVTPIAPSVWSDPPATAPGRTPATSSAPRPSAPAPSPRVPPVPSHARPMPASESQISVAAHRPPVSRNDRSGALPSVIVDVASEYIDLVARVVAARDVAARPAEDAEAELLRAGGHAMPAIMAQFPGPVTIEPDRLTEGPLPRVADCGPVLRLIASQRRTALPFVLARVDDADPERRFWATYLLTELVYPDVLEPILLRVFDAEPRVRRVARAAARAFAEAHPATIVERLELVAMDGGEKRERRLLALEALGETREALAVPALVPLLDDPEPAIVTAVRAALTTITRQDFATSSDRWNAWWSQNHDRHRLEWLIDALMHEHAALRAAAGEELKTTTKEYFGYYDDLPKRERERAQTRYRDWWDQIGRVRFNRSSSSRG